MCARYLNNKQDQRYSKLYSEAVVKYMKSTRKKENENQQDDKEIENYRDRPYFLKILNSINYNDIKTIEAHYQYLILALLTLQPPIRTSFYTTAQFITLDKEDNKQDNFICIDRQETLKVYYIINKDKASNYKLYNMNKDLNKIKIENETLTKLIYNSYLNYPRKYL